MTYESFRPWAHGSPSPAWIIHFDSETFGLIWGAISRLAERWTVKMSGGVLFFFVCVFICQLRYSSQECVLENDNNLGMNENTGNHF